MSNELSYYLGERHGRPYFLHLRAEPSFERIRDFTAVLFYNDPISEETVEIARIDTAHGFTHFDKLYRRDAPKTPVEVDAWEAVDFLDSNWRRYADSYESAHGN